MLVILRGEKPRQRGAFWDKALFSLDTAVHQSAWSQARTPRPPPGGFTQILESGVSPGALGGRSCGCPRVPPGASRDHGGLGWKVPAGADPWPGSRLLHDPWRLLGVSVSGPVSEGGDSQAAAAPGGLSGVPSV